MAHAKLVTIDIVKTQNGLLRATSEDVRGLHVVAETLDTLKERAKSMLRDLFHANGEDVSIYETERASKDASPPWVIIPRPSDRLAC